jgi:hypothetical protein
MKRDKLKYEVYKHYGLFIWQQCFACNQEFRREKSFRLWTGPRQGFFYICSGCASTKEEAIIAFDKKISIRPQPPASPPRSK